MRNGSLIRLGDIAKVTSGYAFKSSEFGSSGIPAIKIKNVRVGTIDLSEADCVHEKNKSLPDRYHSKPGDILISLTGSHLTQPNSVVGRVARHAHDLPACLINQRVGKVTVRRDAAVDGAYLFYTLSSPQAMRTIALMAHGAASQANVSPSQVESLELSIPSLETQRRIATILGAYDDLIEVNRRRVAVLEEMARGLFEEWFVRFRFPGHEDVPIVDTPVGQLPEGWEWINLYDAAEVAFGFAFKSKAFTSEPVGSRVVRIRDVQEGCTSTWTAEPFDSRYSVRNGDLLVGMDGIFHTNVWIGGDAALNQRVTRLRPKKGLSVGWLFRGVLPKIKFFEATISGTTVAHLGAKHLKKIYLPLADEAKQRVADAFFAPIDEELVNLKVANEKLAASRDLLLHRLISGQLSVEAAERELEDAA